MLFFSKLTVDAAHHVCPKAEPRFKIQQADRFDRLEMLSVLSLHLFEQRVEFLVGVIGMVARELLLCGFPRRFGKLPGDVVSVALCALISCHAVRHDISPPYSFFG